jgi:hypothetical protein
MDSMSDIGQTTCLLTSAGSSMPLDPKAQAAAATPAVDGVGSMLVLAQRCVGECTETNGMGLGWPLGFLYLPAQGHMWDYKSVTYPCNQT